MGSQKKAQPGCSQRRFYPKKNPKRVPTWKNRTNLVNYNPLVCVKPFAKAGIYGYDINKHTAKTGKTIGIFDWETTTPHKKCV